MSKSVRKRTAIQEYPRIAELGVTVHTEERNGQAYPSYVLNDELEVALVRKWGTAGVKKFNELFGCQTCVAEGPYPWDVEAVLERMMSGKLTGSQLILD